MDILNILWNVYIGVIIAMFFGSLIAAAIEPEGFMLTIKEQKGRLLVSIFLFWPLFLIYFLGKVFYTAFIRNF